MAGKKGRLSGFENTLTLPREKKCSGPCKLVKPFTEFYIVDGRSYPDHLSRSCKDCNVILKNKGREELEKRIKHAEMLIEVMKRVLEERAAR
jgi:hypothetical protein